MTTTLTIEINVEPESKTCEECEHYRLDRPTDHCLLFMVQGLNDKRLPQCIAAQDEKKDWISYPETKPPKEGYYVATGLKHGIFLEYCIYWNGGLDTDYRFFEQENVVAWREQNPYNKNGV